MDIKETLALHAIWLRDERCGVRADLSNANLSESDLNGADLNGANLSESDLNGAKLSKANLRGANLRDADLSNANLSESDLRGADLNGANLSGADLSGAKLNGANLSESDLNGAKLSKANLRSANLRSANMRDTHVMVIYGHPWPVIIYPESLAIGCERHAVECWREFGDDEIEEMETRALDWWREWKEIILDTAIKVQS